MHSLYVFRSIQPILSSEELTNVILSKTQRKTPTEVHPGYQISRIRAFYMRKVKFSAEAFNEKLDNILNGFPKLNEIHPFYADWLNILYDKDHYKIALGQVHTIRGVIERVAKDYLKLLKYGDSLYRCKTLKVAALGRMCTAVKRLKSSLNYLEEIRKHISRLPAIDPFSPTLLLVGPPNVGKSSFINKITKANVEVSPMPFSTQNLFLGVCEFKNVRVQIIDSPGLLNRPLEQRNTIEMQSIAALAHLKTCILFMADISETCGYLLHEQLKLFAELTPLFANKPVFLVLNKADIVSRQNLPSELAELLREFEGERPSIRVLENTSIDAGVTFATAEAAAQTLLDFRQQQKKEQGLTLKSDEDYYRGVRVAYPRALRGSKPREAFIPPSVAAERGESKREARKTLKDFEEESGGAGVFHFPLQEHHLLERPEWKYDIVPEIVNGLNIIDFVDPDIEERLNALEREESLRIAAHVGDDAYEGDATFQRNKRALAAVKREIARRKIQSNLRKKLKAPRGDAAVKDLEAHLQNNNIEAEPILEKIKRSGRNATAKDSSGMIIEGNDEDKRDSFLKARLAKRNIGIRKPQLSHKIMKKKLSTKDKEEIRKIKYSKMPKHLFSGKRGAGKADRR